MCANPGGSSSLWSLRPCVPEGHECIIYLLSLLAEGCLPEKALGDVGGDPDAGVAQEGVSYGLE